jgi:uncharacterized membrane protein YsdA (DUF1294 family)
MCKNEPNLAPSEGKCAKQTQSWPPAEEVARGRPTPDQVGGRLYEEPKRAKRSQFARSIRHRMPAAPLAAQGVYCLLTIPRCVGLLVGLMQRYTATQCILGFFVCAAIGLLLLFWRSGLGPLYAYLVSVNVVTLLLYGYDKQRAIVGGTRVPEAALHLAALLGGSPAAALGQGLFRHKMQKHRFQTILVATVLLQAAVLYGYWRFLYSK